MMKKNAQIHLLIESEVFENLQNQAIERNISFSEMCRQKLRQNNQLDKLELMIEEIKEKLNIQLKLKGGDKNGKRIAKI